MDKLGSFVSAVVDWCAAHPKATAVLVALGVGIIVGVWLAH